MTDFDTDAVSETMLTNSAPDDTQKKRRGRPPLSDEEKARRAELRASAKDKAPGGRGRGRPPGRKDLPLIEETIGQYVTLIGVGLGTLPNPKLQADGIVIVQQSDSFSHAWCELAKTDTRVYNALRKLCVGGAWGGVVIASASIAMPIAANHGIIPAFVASMFASGSEDESNGFPLTDSEAEELAELHGKNSDGN